MKTCRNQPEDPVLEASWKDRYEADELLDVPCPACIARRPEDLAREFGVTVSRCCACGLVYTRTPRHASQDHYAVSEAAFLVKYGDVFSGLADHPRDRNYEEHLDLLAGLTPPGDLLDVGSHCGFFLRRARARGWRVVGVEPSPAAAALARNQFGLDVRTGYLGEAGLAESAFDLVTVVDVLEHMPDPRAELREIRRILRPGGLVFIKVPNVRYLLAKYRLARRFSRTALDSFDAREHLVHYSRSTLVRLLEETGFSIAKTAVPSPIQTGGRVRRLLRSLGPLLARRISRGVDLPLATDVAVLAQKPVESVPPPAHSSP